MFYVKSINFGLKLNFFDRVFLTIYEKVSNMKLSKVQFNEITAVLFS